jgi:hypothetical protein
MYHVRSGSGMEEVHLRSSEWMIKQKTHPATKRIISERLLAWHSGKSGSARGDSISALGGERTECARVANMLEEGGLAFDWKTGGSRP